MKTLKISKKSLETAGSHFIEGLIFKEFEELPKELRIEFEQTTTGWRAAHGGPEEIILSEYVPMALCESILRLAKRCEKLEIGEYSS